MSQKNKFSTRIALYGKTIKTMKEFKLLRTITDTRLCHYYLFLPVKFSFHAMCLDLNMYAILHHCEYTPLSFSLSLSHICLHKLNKIIFLILHLKKKCIFWFKTYVKLRGKLVLGVL